VFVCPVIEQSFADLNSFCHWGISSANQASNAPKLDVKLMSRSSQFAREWRRQNFKHRAGAVAYEQALSVSKTPSFHIHSCNCSS
jgi:hypothetical protein